MLSTLSFIIIFCSGKISKNCKRDSPQCSSEIACPLFALQTMSWLTIFIQHYRTQHRQKLRYKKTNFFCIKLVTRLELMYSHVHAISSQCNKYAALGTTFTGEILLQRFIQGSSSSSVLCTAFCPYKHSRTRLPDQNILLK